MINDQLNLFSVAEGVFFITRFKECARRGGWMIKLNWKFHKNKLPSLEKLCISSRLYHHSQKKRSLAITRERTSMNRYCTYSARTILAICSMQPKRKKRECLQLFTTDMISDCAFKMHGKERYSSSSSLSLCTSFMSRSNLYEKLKPIMISQQQ